MRELPARKLTTEQKLEQSGGGPSLVCHQVAVFPCPQSDNQGPGQECLVGLNVRRPTARMLALLLIAPDLAELRNKS